MDSERERLMRVVMGWSKESRHDFSNLVGRMSREQVESLDDRIIILTSSGVAGVKLIKGGGKTGEGM